MGCIRNQGNGYEIMHAVSDVLEGMRKGYYLKANGFPLRGNFELYCEAVLLKV